MPAVCTPHVFLAYREPVKIFLVCLLVLASCLVFTIAGAVLFARLLKVTLFPLWFLTENPRPRSLVEEVAWYVRFRSSLIFFASATAVL